MANLRQLLSIILFLGGSLAQNYQDYPQYDDYAGDYGGNDNLYRDYVDHKEDQVSGGGGGGG